MHHTHEQHTVELSKLSTQLQLGGVNNKGQIAAESAGNQVQIILQLTEENRLLKEAATKLQSVFCLVVFFFLKYRYIN